MAIKKNCPKSQIPIDVDKLQCQKGKIHANINSKHGNLYSKLCHILIWCVWFFFVIHKSSKKPFQLLRTSLHLCICTISNSALSLGNGLIIKEVLHSKKPLPKKIKCINPNAYSCQFYNLFFMKLIMMNASTKRRTWTMIIFVNCMYFENVWLRMGDVVTLHQSFVIKFKLLSSFRNAC